MNTRLGDYAGGKHLDFSAGLSGPWRKAGVAALVLIIGTSVTVTIWAWVRGPQPDRPTHASEKGGTPHVCLECRHEFVMTPRDFEKFMGTLDPEAPGDSRLVHCPKCGARHRGYPMSACPTCREYYLPHGIEHTAKSLRGDPVPLDPPDVCPHCETDIRAYWRKRSRRRSGE